MHFTVENTEAQNLRWFPVIMYPVVTDMAFDTADVHNVYISPW